MQLYHRSKGLRPDVHTFSHITDAREQAPLRSRVAPARKRGCLQWFFPLAISLFPL
nr:MAG TPA: hypothetical protein [Caudoviricetes sp.]